MENKDANQKENSNYFASGMAVLRTLRRSLKSMRAQQYQILMVDGVVETEVEYQVKINKFNKLNSI